MSNPNTETDISKEQLRNKPVAEWTDQEREVAKDLTHTLAVSLHNARRLDDLVGSKTQSWDDIMGTALDRLEEAEDHE
jgi:GAF domain-containing protein